MSLLENKFDYLLSSSIPKGDFTDTDIAMLRSNFIELKDLIQAEDLYNLEYIMYKAVDYYNSVKGALTKEMLYGYLVSRIDDFMKDEQVKLGDIVGEKMKTMNIDLDGDYNEVKREMMHACVHYYNKLTQIQTSNALFNSIKKLYADEMFEDKYSELLRECAIISNKGLTVYTSGKKRMLKGAVEANKYYNSQYANIESKYLLEEKFDYIDTSEGVLPVMEKLETSMGNLEVVADTGMAPFEESVGKFRRTQLMGIEAGPGAGKSRFARFVAYRGLTLYGKNVYDCTMEQETTEVFYMYLSLHLFCKYNISVTDKEIIDNNVPEHLQAYVNIARADLVENENYGKLRVEAKNSYIETMFEYLETLWETKFKFDIFILDYASLVEAKAQGKYGMSLFEVVTKVYKLSKRILCRKLKTFGLLINQLTKEGVKKLARGEETGAYDAHGSGETYKSTDFNFVLSRVEGEENKLRISNPKVRRGNKMSSIITETRLGQCFFRYTNEEDDLTVKEFEELMMSENI